MIFTNKLKEENHYTCMYDRVFKEVFIDERNPELLYHLLQTCLKVEIKRIEILSSELMNGNIESKRKHIDAHLKTDQGNMDIEINASPTEYLHPRNMSYLCNMYANGLLSGGEYDEETNYIQINFTYHMKEKEKGCQIYKIQNEEGKEYVKNFIIYEFNMAYYMDLWYNKDEKGIEENKYIIMMGLEEKELEELSKRDKLVEEYRRKLMNVTIYQGMMGYMSEEEDRRKIENSIRKFATKEGIEQGIEQGRVEIAKKMMNKGMQVSLIQEMTGLSLKEINKLNDKKKA